MAKNKSTTFSKAKKRKSIRFASDEGALAYILTDSEGNKLKKSIPALVIEESFKGCGLVALKSSLLTVGVQLRVKVGSLDPIMAEVRWVKNSFNKVAYIGLAYLE